MLEAAVVPNPSLTLPAKSAHPSLTLLPLDPTPCYPYPYPYPYHSSSHPSPYPNANPNPHLLRPLHRSLCEPTSRLLCPLTSSPIPP